MTITTRVFAAFLCLLMALPAQARYYDAATGRFLSADTIVPAPADPQSLNRYAYVRNNPLKYTDPTGHFAWLAPVIVGAVVGAVSTGMQSGWKGDYMLQGAVIGGVAGFAGAGASAMTGGGMLGSIIGGMASGATAGGMAASMYSGDIAGSAIKGAALGGVGGAAFGGIGQRFGNQWGLSRALLQGTASGALSEAGGGDFSHGFALSAGAALAMRGLQLATLSTVRSQLKGATPTIYNDDGTPVVAGTRACPQCDTHSMDGFLSKLEMLPHNANPNRIFGVQYDISSQFGKYVNQIGGFHDWMNSWNYGADGNNMPGNAGFQLMFGAYSFAGMPVAAAYTSFALSAPTYQPYFGNE